jgi:serine/threonine protein kinase
MDLRMIDIPRHPHIGTILHCFTGHIPSSNSSHTSTMMPSTSSSGYPPDWNDTPEVVNTHSLFIIQELLSFFSLPQIVTYRTKLLSPSTSTSIGATTVTSESKKAPAAVAPVVFRIEEFLLLAHDISNGLCHLYSHRIAHRHLTPANIYFRIPSNIKATDAMLNIAQRGITVVICDFSYAYDFIAMGTRTMLMACLVGLLSCYDMYTRCKQIFDRSVHATSDSSSNGSLTPSRTLPFNDDIWSGIMKQSISVAQRQSQAPIKHSQWYSTDASLRSAWTLRITRQCICVHPLPISTRVPSSTIPTITSDKKYDSVPTDVVLFDGPLARGSFAAVYEGSCQLNGVITRVAVKI